MVEDVAVIGIGIKTHGNETAIRSLKDLVAWGGKAEATVGGLQGASDRTQKSVESLGVTLKGLASLLGVRELISLTDQYTKYTAQLKLATGTTSAFASSMNQVRAISNAAQQDISAVGTLYARIANGTRELGISQQRMAAITETVSLSLKVSGAAASESASAMLQLSQAFASGVLRGEEFNAVNEAAPRLMKALADGIGVPVGALKEMASEGKITSEIMANALPRALAELREEAKSVQTIGGSFTVLKNNVLEFVGTQAQASGAVTVLTTAIDGLANNLNLVAAAGTGLAAAKVADVIIGIGAATVKGVGSTLQYAEALAAQRAATLASAQADVQATAAKAASIQAVQAAIVLSREEYATKLALANTSAAQAAAQIAAAKAAGAQSFALASVRQGELQLLAAQQARAAALAELAILGQHQVSVSAKTTAALAAQTAAQAALNTATSAGGVAAGLARGALGLLGGPIGAITTLLGLGATAWMLWGNSTEKAIDQAEKSLFDRAADLRNELQAQIDLIDKRNAALAGGAPVKESKSLATLGELQQEIDRLKGQETKSAAEELARQAQLQRATRDYAETAKKAREAEEKQNGSDAVQSANALVDVRQRLLGVNKQYLEDLQKYQAALEKGGISREDYIKEVSALAKKTFDASAMGKEMKGAADGVADSLNAQVQAYKNADKAILDSRKDFYDQLALQVKLGTKTELEAAEESIALEDATWAKRQANFQAELAAAGAKKNSATEVARITGQMQDAERDYYQNVAKLQADALIAEMRYASAIEDRVSKQRSAAEAVQEQVYAAQQAGRAIGLTGDALREFNAEQLDRSIPLALKMQATWAGMGGELGAIGDAARAQIQAIRDLNSAMGENRAAQMVYEYKKGIEDSNKLLQAELGLMGLSEQAREIALEQLRIQLDLETKIAAIKASMDDTPERAQKIAEIEAAAAIAKANASSRVFLQEWKDSVKQYDDIFRQGFADMLNRGEDGWKSFTKSLATTFKTTVADALYKAFAQPFVIRIVGQLMGLTGGAGGAALQAASGGGGLLGGLNPMSGLNMIGGAFGAGMSAGFGGLMGSLGLTGTGTTLGGALSAGSIALGSGNILGALGTFAGALGPIALGLGALASLFGGFDKSGTPHIGGSAAWSSSQGLRTNLNFLDDQEGLPGYNPNDNIDNQFGSGMPWVQDNEQVRGTLGVMAQTIASTLDSFAKAFGQTAGHEVALGFADDSSKDGSWGALRIALGDRELLNWNDDRQSRWAPRIFSDGEQGWQEFTAATAQDLRDVMTEMDIPGWVKDSLEGLGDSFDLDALGAVVTQIGAVNTAFDALGFGVAAFADLTDEARGRLIQESGGLQGFAASASNYYDKFYTDDEKQAFKENALSKELELLGLEMPNTQRGFRELVEAQIALGESGAETAARLMGLSDAAFEVLPAADEATSALRTMADAAKESFGITADSIKGLLDDILENAGSANEARNMGASGFEEMVTSAIFDSLLSNISGMVMAQIVAPLIAGATTSGAVLAAGGATGGAAVAGGGVMGGSASAAGGSVAGQSIAQGGAAAASAMVAGGAAVGTVVGDVLEAARAQMQAVSGLLNDPAFADMLAEFGKGFGDLSSDLFDLKSSIGGGLSSVGGSFGGAASAAEGLEASLKGLTSAIEDEIKRLRGIMEEASPNKGYDALMGEFATTTAAARAGDEEALEKLPSLSKQIEALLPDRATSSSELAQMRGWLAGSLSETLKGIADTKAAKEAAAQEAKRLQDEANWRGRYEGGKYFAWLEAGSPIGGWSDEEYEDWYTRKYLGINALATGTNYVPKDMLALIHEGEAVVPKQYNPAAGGQQVVVPQAFAQSFTGGESEIVAELRELRNEVAQLREQNEALALDAQRLRLRQARTQERTEGLIAMQEEKASA